MAPGVKHIWTAEEVSFLKKNFKKKTNKELAEALGLTLTLTRTKLYELGLKRMELQYWTKEQVEFLKANYKEIGDTELAEIFNKKWHKKKGWTLKHIEKKRRYLKLKRTKFQLKKIKERNTDNGCFAECAKKRWEKTGTFPIGQVRIWKTSEGHRFKVIKTKEGYVHYNRWLWEQHNGPIPKDMIIRTKNNESLDVRIENLEMINRGDHAYKNKILKYPKELQEALQLNRKLKHELNKKEEQ